MAQKYEYVVDNSGVKLVQDATVITAPEGFEKEDGEFSKITELEELLLVETRPVITTEIVVYVTGFFTNGGDSKFVELRVRVPVTYTAGEEGAAVDLIEEKALEAIGNFDSNFSSDAFEITSIDPDIRPMIAESEEAIDVEFIAKPAVGGGVLPPIDIPEPIEETVGIISEIVTGVVKTAGKVVGGIVKGIGRLFGFK